MISKKAIISKEAMDWSKAETKRLLVESESYREMPEEMVKKIEIRRAQDYQKVIDHREKREQRLQKLEDRAKKQAEKVEIERQKYLEGRSKKVIPKTFNLEKEPNGYFFEPARNRFRVQFRFKGQVYSFGSYDTEEEAEAVYKHELRQLEILYRAAYSEELSLQS